MDLTATISRFILGGVFLYFGMAKLGNRPEFAKAVENYRLLPRPIAALTARFLPWVEVSLGSAFAVGIVTRWIGLVAVVLLTTFTLGITINLLNGREIDCGCAGQRFSKIGWSTVIRNLLLIGMSAAVASRASFPLAVEALWTTPTSHLSANQSLAILLAVSSMAMVLTLWRAAGTLTTASHDFSRVLKGGG